MAGAALSIVEGVGVILIAARCIQYLHDVVRSTPLVLFMGRMWSYMKVDGKLTRCYIICAEVMFSLNAVSLQSVVLSVIKL